MKTCKTCRFWNFKVSTDKCWGQCLNVDAQMGFYVSIKIPNLESTVEIETFQKLARENTEVYFEENSFGCIHHMKELREIEKEVDGNHINSR